MSNLDNIVQEVLANAGIARRWRRMEVERELRTHLEDLVEEAGKAGCHAKDIENYVQCRFGSPQNVAATFSGVYRRERLLLATISTATLGLVMSLVGACFVGVTQWSLLAAFGRLDPRAFSRSHLLMELILTVGTILGFLAFYLLEHSFVRRPVAKAILSVIALFLITDLVLRIWVVAPGGALIGAFFCAVLVRAAEGCFRSRMWKLTFTVIGITGFGVAVACLGRGASADTWTLVGPVWMSVAASCALVAWCSERYGPVLLTSSPA